MPAFTGDAATTITEAPATAGRGNYTNSAALTLTEAPTESDIHHGSMNAALTIAQASSNSGTPLMDTWIPITVDGVPFIELQTARFRVPVVWDPSSNLFIAVAPPFGSLGNFPAIAQGAPGDSASLAAPILVTPLAYSDPTPASGSFTEISPGVYQASLSLHEGTPGVVGSFTLLGATDLVGSPVAGQAVVVNPGANGFVYQAQYVGDRYSPSSIASTPAGNQNYTLCLVGIPEQLFDWRPRCQGWTVVTGTGPNVQVDLVARLNNETAGNIVARGTQPAGQFPATHTLAAAPPAGSADSYDKVLAGVIATIYLRVERQSGTDTYTTSNSTTLFSVEVMPISS